TGWVGRGRGFAARGQRRHHDPGGAEGDFRVLGEGMETADAVIAGGWVMGCALAYELARRGVDVLLLERDELGSQSTARCAGGVRQQFSSEANVRVQMLSVKILETFEQEIGVTPDSRQIAYLFVLTRPEHVQDFRALVQMWHRCGLEEASWVEPE